MSGWFGGEGIYKDPGGRCPSPHQLEPVAVKVAPLTAGDKQKVSGSEERGTGVGWVDGESWD